MYLVKEVSQLNKLTLTSEQQQVVQHPIGRHARVLAVAGSGKSITLAYRIKYLVLEENVQPDTIKVLMFNALAREQFHKHLVRVGLQDILQPEVHTFHSFSYKVIQTMTRNGVLPELIQYWLGDKQELIWLTVKRAITNLEKARRIPPASADPETALNAIGLWKGALLPPERAGSRNSTSLPLVYAEYERLRRQKGALTFDDFIPMALELLEGNPVAYQRWCQGVQYVIVDEYQDINFGQQTLIEVLAGDDADVMVVGDDDQTIYEWRGARPNYIIQDFPKVFDNKPAHDYCLSRSFRFGPVIAQCAASLIASNTNRVQKPLVAHMTSKHGFVHVFNGGYDATKTLAEQVLALVQVDSVPQVEIIVLARLFAQLDTLEAEFLGREIPYRVDGHEPFFKRREVKALLDYIRLARVLHLQMNNEMGAWLLNVANKPSRMLSRYVLSKLIKEAQRERLSTSQILELAAESGMIGLNVMQQRRVIVLLAFIQAIHDRLETGLESAGELLNWMISETDYLAYFHDYYGKGEHADEKKQAVLNFIDYVSYTRVKPLELLKLVEELDTTQGAPPDEQIIFTTIFRTKGLEYDYVVIPQCDENALPYLKGERTAIYDKRGRFQEAPISDKLESERRLFYVAITRARKGVMIGTSANPSRFLQELQLQKGETLLA